MAVACRRIDGVCWAPLPCQPFLLPLHCPSTGGERRLPAHAVLRACGCGQEDAHPGAAAGDLRGRRREGVAGRAGPGAALLLLQYGPPPSQPPTPYLLQLKVECKPWKIQLPSRVLELEFTTISSAYHVEMNPSDVGNNDRCGPRRRPLWQPACAPPPPPSPSRAALPSLLVGTMTVRR